MTRYKKYINKLPESARKASDLRGLKDANTRRVKK